VLESALKGLLYTEGVIARRKGEPRTSAPNLENSAEWHAWLAGWDSLDINAGNPANFAAGLV
jgi:hypothetical protein